MMRLSASSKLMAGGLAVSLGFLLFTGCFCDDSKQAKHPAAWVVCVGNKPQLLEYYYDAVVPGKDVNFDASKYDCTHPDSPAYKGSEASPVSLVNPESTAARRRQATPGSRVTFLPQQLRDLPFLPPNPSPGSPPDCDSSFPDVLQTVHTRALVTRISTCPFQIKTSIPVVSRPLQIAVTPDGLTALVTSFDNAVNFIDLATNQVTFTLMTDSTINPHGIAILPDGSRAYITSFTPGVGAVQVIDLATRKIVSTISVGSFPQGATLTPDGSQLWITYPLGQVVDVIDTLTNTSAARIGVSLTTDVAFNSTGTQAYITGSPSSVYVIDTSTYMVIRTYQVGLGPTDIQMSYGDEFLVVNNSSGNSISVIDLLKDTVVTAPVGGVPSGIAFVR
jgi:YVTN family beta-propeller protein